MKFLNKETNTKILNALLATIAISAIFHLVLVSVVAIVKRDISYVNPLDFLGISILLPQYRESTSVAALGWIILILLYFGILFIRMHYHLYVAIIRETKLANQLAQTTRSLRDKVNRFSE